MQSSAPLCGDLQTETTAVIGVTIGVSVYYTIAFYHQDHPDSSCNCFEGLCGSAAVVDQVKQQSLSTSGVGIARDAWSWS